MAKQDEGGSFFGRNLTTLIVLLFVGVMGFGLFVIWDRFGGEILDGPAYRIAEESIEITPQPAWVRGDVRHEAFVAGSLEGLHIRQTDLAFRVAEAFTMHSWVAKVQHAGKRHSNRVVVDLVYRKPVAMVEVKGGVYPVDVHGVFLPPAGFTADDAGRYPLISADGTSPIGPPGTAWGDARIAGAAKLADFLGPHWKQLGLTRITAHSDHYSDVEPGTTYEVHTTTRQVFTWGRAPGDEARGEAKPDKKIARLREIVLGTVPLDDMLPNQAVDLRFPKVKLAAKPD
ncbi:MAG: hypothetical protein AAGF97_20295 [Planctomycetota bacterium]